MQRGFSLVELSIVLVILGLLTGGILSGQSLIRAAELRSVTTQVSGYGAALFTFRDKYMALPGDMAIATQFWGVAGGSGTGAACFTVASTTTATCNGNGDGQMDQAAGAVSTDTWYYGERWHVWKQLANAGLIEGSYSGRSEGAGNNIIIEGVNLPKSRAGGTISVYYIGTVGPESGNHFGSASNANNMRVSAPLTPQEAWNIDVKLDDGRPAYGFVQGFRSAPTGTWLPNCSTSDVDSTAEYNVLNAAKDCQTNILLR